jgi:uncharacterized membrane protein YphA (DoxX/SURF4 family)
MMAALATPFERAWASFIARGLVGLMFVFAGAQKVMAIGPAAYASRVAALSHLTFYFPGWAIYATAYVTGFVELLLGAMLVLGVRPRLAARALGGMMVLAAAGYGLAGLIDPVGGVTAMDIRAVNTYILPRAALIILYLMLPAEDDALTADRAMRAG